MRSYAQPSVVELWARLTSGSLPDRDAATLVAWGARSPEQAFARIDDGSGSRMHGRLAHALVRAHDHKLTADSKKLELTDLGHELARHGVAAMFNDAQSTGKKRSALLRWKKLSVAMRDALRQAGQGEIRRDSHDVTVLQVLRDMELLTGKGTITKLGRLVLHLGGLEALHDLVVLQHEPGRVQARSAAPATAAACNVPPREPVEPLSTEVIEARKEARRSKALDDLVSAGGELEFWLRGSTAAAPAVQRWREAFDDCVVLGIVKVVPL